MAKKISLFHPHLSINSESTHPLLPLSAAVGWLGATTVVDGWRTAGGSAMVGGGGACRRWHGWLGATAAVVDVGVIAGLWWWSVEVTAELDAWRVVGDGRAVVVGAMV